MPTLKTSISGIRGIIGDGLDIRTVVDYTSAFACLFPKKAKVLVARDTRITGESILNAVVSTLMASGINVIDIGITPTPTALYMVEKLKIHGGIMISASHNPIEWNALKLIGKGGHFLDEKAVNELMKLYDKKSSRFVKALETGTYEKIDNAIEEHIKRILRWIDVEKIKKANFKVACDYVNGTGLFATPPLLKALGVKEVSINNVHTGKFAHVAEPSAASMKSLSDLVKKTGDIQNENVAEGVTASGNAFINRFRRNATMTLTITSEIESDVLVRFSGCTGSANEALPVASYILLSYGTTEDNLTKVDNSSLTFSSKGSWNKFTEFTIGEIHLKKGINYIVLTGIENNGVNCDYIALINPKNETEDTPAYPTLEEKYGDPNFSEYVLGT